MPARAACGPTSSICCAAIAARRRRSHAGARSRAREADKTPMSERRADAPDLRRLLKRLYRFRERRQWRVLDRLFARQRKAALLGALTRAWPGGYVLTEDRK